MDAPAIDLSRAVSVRCRGVRSGETLFESSSPVVLRLLAGYLRLKPATGWVCMCPGTLTFEIPGGVPSVITLHHGTSVRWPGSPGNVDLEAPEKMMDFLAEKGVSFVRDEYRADEERAARAVREAARWRAIAPRSLQRFSDLTDAFPSAAAKRAWATALADEHPDPVARARRLLTWYGDGERGLGSSTVHELVPRDLLTDLPDTVLVEAIRTSDGHASFGALRLLNGLPRKRLDALVRRSPGETLSRLEGDASVRLDDDDRLSLELLHVSLAKRAASRIPPASRKPRSQPIDPARAAVSLPVSTTTRPGANAATFDEAMRELHVQVLAFIRTYAYATDVWHDYLGDRARVEGVVRRATGFAFPDVGRPTSQAIAHRWFRIAVSAASSIEPALSRLGHHLRDVPALRDVFDEARAPILLARDRLWLVRGVPAAPEIVGDGELLEPEHHERARAAVLLSTGETDDPVENMLLPSAAFDASLTGWLRRPGRHLSSALWRASHCVLPSDALVEALLASVAHAEVEEVLAAAARLGARAPSLDLAVGLTSDDSRVRAAALVALVGVARNVTARAPDIVDLLLRAMSRSPIERRVAAEQLGYVTHGRDLERVTAALLSLLKNPAVADDCVEYAVVSLANLYRTDVPEHVTLAVGDVTARTTRAGSLARWFLERNWPA